MKLHSLLAAIAISTAGLTIGTAHAQGVDPCSVYTCMAGISGSGASGGPACTTPIAFFHSMQVWSPHFNSGATASWRRRYLMTCPGAQLPTNLAILNAIIAEWGYTP